MDLKTLNEIPPWEWPEGAGILILETLKNTHADMSEQLIAAELAGDLVVMNDELASALISIAREEKRPEELRKIAVLSMGPVLELADVEEFDDPEEVPISEHTFHKIQQLLQNLYSDDSVPKDVRRQALESAVRAPLDWHQDAIRKAYSSGDDSWKLTAVFCMGYAQGFDEQILEALGSKDEDIHYHAVCAAGNWELDAAWDHIAGLITTRKTEKSLLLAAIEAAAYIRPGQAAEFLAKLAESKDKDIAEAALDAIDIAAISLGNIDAEDEP
jgi:hypothetical protein